MKAFLSQIFVLLLLVIFLSNSYLGQEYRFNNISINDGLIQNTIQDIFEDSRGFIWIGTEEGLDRFDGINFVHYQNDPKNTNSLSSSWIRVICEYPEGTLWIGTEGGGLNKLDLKTDRITRYLHDPDDKNSISSNEIRSMYFDKNNYLWIATDGGGLNKFDIENEKFTSFSSEVIPTNRLLTLFEDESNSFSWSKKLLFLGTYNNGLIVFNKEREQFFRLKFSSPKFENSNLTSIYFNKSFGNRLFIGTNNRGLFWFDLTNDLLHKIQHKLESYPVGIEDGTAINNPFIRCIESLTNDKNENLLLVGTHGGGLNIINHATQKVSYVKNKQDSPHSISDNSIMNLFVDTNGILWCATYSQGVSFIDKEKKKFGYFSVFNEAELDVGYNQIWAIESDEKNNLWIGSDVGLYVLDKNHKYNKTISKRYKKYFDGNSIFQIYKDPFEENDVLWIGTRRNGLYRIDVTADKISVYKNDSKDPKTISSNFIRSILRDDEDKDVLLISTFGGGLNKLKISTGKFTSYKHNPSDSNSISHDYVWQVFKDSKGNYWCGTKDGLNKFDPKHEKFKVFKNNINNKFSISHNHAYNIYEDSNGRLWIATFGGGLNLFDYKEEKFFSIDVGDGLPNNIVYGILEDEKSNLWVSTNDGISKITVSNMPKKIDTTFYKYLSFSNFDVDDGLQSNEFNANAFSKSKDGKLYFGGINGFNYFYPSEIIENKKSPSIYFTSFKIFNKLVDLDTSITEKKVIKLDYNEKMISFEFIALNYIAPKKNQYAYKLEGFNDEWIHLGEKNNIDLTNLPYDQLELKVIASNDDGIWNNKGARLKLIISPPYYETWLFRIFFFSSIITIVSLLYRQRTKFIRNSNKTLNEINIRLNNEIEEKSRMTEVLEQSEHRFRTLYENAIIGIYKMTIEGVPIMINPALLKILKLEKLEDLMKIDITKDLYVKYGERERFYKELNKNKEVIGFETEWKIGDGSIITIRENAKIIKDKVNNTEFIEGSVENITEKKIIEREMIKAKNDAEKSNQVKSEFLAQMSHEIRTPINTLLSYSSLIKSEMEKDLNEEMLYCFTAMKNAGKRITRTIDMILNMSEIQSGSYELIKKTIDISKNILEKIYNEYKFIAAEKGILLKYENEASNSIVRIDDYTVTQLFINLIDNAIKYTEKGSVTIKLINEERSLLVKISDTGIGISEEYLPTIFDAFTQEEQGYSRQYEGNGLGLALVKNYCFMNKAKIEVESAKGKGTTFTVSFTVKQI